MAAYKTTMSDQHRKAVAELEYAVSDEFAGGMYNSCRDVQNPSSGKHALDLLCGDASVCNPAYWLKFLGDKSLNPALPFPIDFVMTSNDTFVPGPNVTLQPMRGRIEPCGESCSCQDCRSQCPPLPPDVPPSRWTILGYDAVCVVVACTYSAFVLVFVLVHVWTGLYGSEDASSSDYIVNGDSDAASLVSSSSSNAVFYRSCDRLQAKFEHLLSAVFAAWGRFCARRPGVIIIASLLVCGVLIVGITMFDVVTDPVQLWSAPNSRARVEKDYFDDNFG